MEKKERVILEHFPFLTEFLADAGIGYLIIILFYPFLHFLLYYPSNIEYSMLINNFVSSWQDIRELSTAEWFLSIFVAFIIGIASRHPLWVVMSLCKKIKIENLFAHLAYKTLKIQFGKDIFAFSEVKKNFLDKSPFWNIGDQDYADFRVNLISTEGDFKRLRPHWGHEEFLWFQHCRLYSFVLTFLLIYFLYGLFIILKGSIFDLKYFLLWLTLLSITFFIAFSLYRGQIFHGMAFETVNDLLLNKFKKKQNELENG